MPSAVRMALAHIPDRGHLGVPDVSPTMAAKERAAGHRVARPPHLGMAGGRGIDPAVRGMAGPARCDEVELVTEVG